MSKKTKETPQLSDYKSAKQVINSLDLHGTVVVSVNKVENFRKYIRDLCFDKQYITRILDDKLSITRLK